MFWLPLCVHLYGHVHVCSVIIRYHWIQDSWSYKLILSTYLCGRNVEALLWLNRSFTIIFISLPLREKSILHFMISTSTFTTGSSLLLSRLGFFGPYLEYSACIHFSCTCPERMSHNLSWACIHSPENRKPLQFSRAFFTPLTRRVKGSKPFLHLESAL